MKNTLKNPEKADLDKDGKLTSYEEKRGQAIEEAMSNKAYLGGLLRVAPRVLRGASNIGKKLINKYKEKKYGSKFKKELEKANVNIDGKKGGLDISDYRAKTLNTKKKKFGGMAIQGVKDPNKIHRS